jgi:hypothetical protein
MGVNDGRNTRVAVCCYEGDGHQVIEALEFFLHHELPLTVLSPDDSRVEVNYPGVTSRYGGKRAYIGQDSLDRQAEHLRLLLEFPEDTFLIHDADSVLLDPKLPQYLYDEPDVVWSNQVNDAIPEHQTTFKRGWPHVAFQPPYFLSRKSIEAMLAVKDHPDVQATPVMPFIDYYMVQLTMVAGLPWKRLLDAISCPISIDLRKKNPSAADLQTYAMGIKIASDAVANNGTSVLHSIKNSVAIRHLAELHKDFLVRNPGYEPRFFPAPKIGRGPLDVTGQPVQGSSGLKA